MRPFFFLHVRWLGRFAPILLLLTGGCQSVYYGTMEKFGVHKREILVDRVEDGKESQQKAKEEFAGALEAFLSLAEVEPGQLEEKYEEARRAYERSEARAQAVWDRIASIREVADALFKEWEEELGEYASERLRRTSERQLEGSRRRYEKMIEAMEQAAAKMMPVLAALNDQRLFLKHNLNARAVAGLQKVFRNSEADIGELIADMEVAIAAAEAYIEEMRQPEGRGA